MKVKSGFKDTEVGQIPEDWTVQTLGSLCDITAGRDLVKQDYSPITDAQYRYPIYANAATTDGLYGYSKSFQYESERITVTGRGAGVGKAVFRDSPFCAIGRLLVLSPKRPCDLRYVTEFINNIVKFAFESTGVPQLTAPQIARYSIALPPTESEQGAIAAVVSDVDALLSALDQLITKKRDLKQAAMQRLLTGRTRLSGFTQSKSLTKSSVGSVPADWRTVQLGDLTTSHKQGYYTKERYVDEGVRLIRITDLRNPRIDYSTMPKLRLPAAERELYRARVGDFLFARSGAIGRYGIVYEDSGAVFGSYIIRFTFDASKLKNEYFGYLYETPGIQSQLLSITQGSSNININATNIKSLKIPLPRIDEQTAIAEVLTDMDAEIAALEQRLAKTYSLKQGMMQELLTGKTRLVSPQEAHA